MSTGPKEISSNSRLSAASSFPWSAVVAKLRIEALDEGLTTVGVFILGFDARDAFCV